MDWVLTFPGGADPQNLCWVSSSQLDLGRGWSQMLQEYPGKNAHLGSRNEVSVYSPALALPREAFHGSQPWKTTGLPQKREWERTGSREGSDPSKTGEKNVLGVDAEPKWSQDQEEEKRGMGIFSHVELQGEFLVVENPSVLLSQFPGNCPGLEKLLRTRLIARVNPKIFSGSWERFPCLGPIQEVPPLDIGIWG